MENKLSMWECQVNKCDTIKMQMAHAHYFALRYLYATELKVGGGSQVLMHSILTGYRST